MTPTGVLFSYAIGAIFAVGGLLFLIALDDNRLLFGVPYLIMGLVDRKSTRLNSSHLTQSRMPSSA